MFSLVFVGVVSFGFWVIGCDCGLIDSWCYCELFGVGIRQFFGGCSALFFTLIVLLDCGFWMHTCSTNCYYIRHLMFSDPMIVRFVCGLVLCYLGLFWVYDFGLVWVWIVGGFAVWFAVVGFIWIYVFVFGY